MGLMSSPGRLDGLHRARTGVPGLVLAADQIVIDAKTLRAVWILLAVLTLVLLWALYELRRRRKLALRLDRLANVSGSPRYPTAAMRTPGDYEALLEIISLDERLPAIAHRVEELASHDVDEPVDDEVDAGTSGP
jgi:hypothetical protein